MLEYFEAPFMQRAAVVVLALAVAGAAVGVHVYLRRLAFLTEAFQHTVFPGIAVAFLWDGPLILGAGVAAVATIAFVALTRRFSVDEDALIAVAVTIFFAGGVVAISGRPGFQQDFTSLLFGRVLALDTAQVWETLATASVAVVLLVAVHKELVLRAFDVVSSRAMGYRVGWLDVLLNVCIALVVMAGIRAVGTVLLVAFIVTPAVAARLVARRVPAMLAVSGAVILFGGLTGLVLSYDASIRYDADVPAGAAMVLCITVLLLPAWFFSLVRNRVRA